MSAAPKVFALCAAIFAAACGSVAEPGPPTAAGAYLLTMIDLRSVPTAQAAGDSVLTGGAVLYDDGEYQINWLAPSFYFGTRQVIAGNDAGHWTATGSQLEFQSRFGSKWIGSFGSGSLSMHFGADDWTFTKQ